MELRSTLKIANHSKYREFVVIRHLAMSKYGILKGTEDIAHIIYNIRVHYSMNWLHTCININKSVLMVYLNIVTFIKAMYLYYTTKELCPFSSFGNKYKQWNCISWYVLTRMEAFPRYQINSVDSCQIFSSSSDIRSPRGEFNDRWNWIHKVNCDI